MSQTPQQVQEAGPPPGDLALVARMSRLLSEHGAEVLAYARRHIPPDLTREVDPQDVLQDASVEAYRRLREFVPTGPDADRRWLLTIARHRIASLVVARRAAKRGGGWVDRLARASADDLVALLEELAVYARTPSRSAADREAAARLQAAIDELPADHARVVRLRHIEGRPAAEVAAAMGRTEPAVHMLARRALDALRRSLADGEASRA